MYIFDFENLVAIRHMELGQVPAMNSETYDFKLLRPMATTNRGALRQRNFVCDFKKPLDNMRTRPLLILCLNFSEIHNNMI